MFLKNGREGSIARKGSEGLLRLFLKRCLKAVIILVCLLCFLELFVRFVLKQPYYAFPQGYFVENPHYGYSLAKNFKGTYSQPEFTIALDTNSYGLRDTEQNPKSDEWRILALGDSFTYGLGVELPDTYLSILERKLNRSFQGKRFSIIKAGVVGYSTFNERLYLEQEGFLWRPRLVLVQFWWDDLGIDRITLLADTGLLASGKINNSAHLRLFLNRRVRLYAFMRRLFTRQFKRALFGCNISNEKGDALEKTIQVTTGEFQKIKDDCSQKGIPVVFLLLPPKEFLVHPDGEKQWERLLAALRGKGMSFVDAFPGLAVNKQGGGYFYRADPHLTSAGNAVVAELLYRHLMEGGYLRERK